MSEQRNQRATDRFSIRLGIILALLTAGGLAYKFGNWLLVAILSSTFETQVAHAEDMARHEKNESIQRQLLAEEIVNRVEAIHKHRDR